MTETARIIHGHAETAREIEQDFNKSLRLLDEAFDTYIKEGDLLGAAETQASRFIVYKHKYQQTGNGAYLILGRNAALSGVEIARLSGKREALVMPLFNLGKAYFEMKDWGKAEEAYGEALGIMEKTPPELHNRPAVKLDMEGHYYTALYMDGDESALSIAMNIAEELKNTDEISQYNKDVWLSGAYLRIAAMLKLDGDQEEAEEYLDKARQVIDSNEELKLRRGQLEAVEKIVNS